MNDKNPQITLAIPEDVLDMQNVFYKTWLATYPNPELGITADDIEHRFKDSFTKETLEKRAESLRHPDEGHVMLVAKWDGKVVGLCFVICNSDTNRLLAIYILPEYQRRGIGNALWNVAKRYLDPNRDILVAVATYNTNAINFYKSYGFEDTGKRWSDEKFRLKSGAMIPEMELVLKRAYGSCA